MQHDPHVLILENKRVRSWPKTAQPKLHARIPLAQALATQWNCDAHIALYGIRGMNEPMPRLGKTALPRLRTMQQEPVLSSFWFDVDNPGHAPWRPEDRERLNADMAKAWRWLQRARAIYATKGGYRVVFALPYELSVEQWLGYEYALVQALQGCGLPIDLSTTGQWTRLFRLPQVVRDGEKSWEDPYYFMLAPTEEPWNIVDELQPNYDRVAQASGHKRKLGALPMPTDMDPDALRGAFYQAMRLRFSREPWGPAVFPDRRTKSDTWKPLADLGGRHNMIVAVVGIMAPIAAHLDQQAGGDGRFASPEALWSILYEPIEALGGDDKENFHLTAWNAILDFWSTEIEGEEGEEEEGEDPDALAPTRAGAKPPRSLFQNIDPQVLLFNVQQWLPEATIEWLRCHSIVRNDRVCFVIGNDGYYKRQPIPIAHEGVTNIIRQRGLTGLIPLKTITATGEMRDRPLASVMRENVHQVADIRFAPSYEGTLNLDENALELPCHRLCALEPERDARVEEFLYCFADQDPAKYQHLCWILAGALATREGRMPAVHFFGPPGAGKGMLVSAIARAFTPDSLVVTGETFFSRFNDLMLQTPIVHIDEKMPETKGAASARFRSACSGDPIPIEPKGLGLVRMRAPYRILITTNSPHAIRALFRGESLVQDDIDAIRERLQIFKVSQHARDWLQRNGNYQTTEGWLDRHNPRLTRHLIWLYEQYRPYFEKCNQRFLLPPNMDLARVSEHIFSLESVKGIVLLVMQDFYDAAKVTKNPQAALSLAPDGRELLYINEMSFLSATRETIERSGIRESRTDHHIRERIEQWGFAAVVREKAGRAIRVDVPGLLKTLQAYDRA